MSKRAGEEQPNPEEALEQALAAIMEEIRVLHSQQSFGRIEVHMKRGRVEMIRTVRDTKIK